MAKGFKTMPGSLTIIGLMGAPLWLWARRYVMCKLKALSKDHQVFAMAGLVYALTCHVSCRFHAASVFASPTVGFVVITGRLLCASVEFWVVYAHLNDLLQH